jgi:hypothetical protein
LLATVVTASHPNLRTAPAVHRVANETNDQVKADGNEA